MLNRVRNDVFIFLRSIGGTGSAYSKAMEDTVFQITNARLLSRVVEGIEELASDGADMMGDVYEYMLGKMAASGTNGQFRTPRHIIRMMVELMKPTLDDIVCDPAMGSAGFIMEAAKYIQEHQSDELLNIETMNRFRSEIFHGSDSDASMMRIGCMNMMLHDVDEPQLYYRNSLSDENNDTNKYTLCLANPPFAGSLDQDDIAPSLRAAVKTKKTELLFLALMMRMLQAGGRCASIVPDTVLTGDAHWLMTTACKPLSRCQAEYSSLTVVFPQLSSSLPRQGQAALTRYGSTICVQMVFPLRHNAHQCLNKMTYLILSVDFTILVEKLNALSKNSPSLYQLKRYVRMATT